MPFLTLALAVSGIFRSAEVVLDLKRDEEGGERKRERLKIKL
jgi:hypothetical protein